MGTGPRDDPLRAARRRLLEGKHNHPYQARSGLLECPEAAPDRPGPIVLDNPIGGRMSRLDSNEAMKAMTRVLEEAGLEEHDPVFDQAHEVMSCLQHEIEAKHDIDSRLTDLIEDRRMARLSDAGLVPSRLGDQLDRLAGTSQWRFWKTEPWVTLEEAGL